MDYYKVLENYLTENGYDYGRMSGLDWARLIDSRIPVSRHRLNLTWGHHMVVAVLPEDEQEYWFDRAENEHLSAKELRDSIVKEG